MKRFTALLVFLIITLSFTACSNREYKLTLPEKEDVQYIEFSLNGSVNKTTLENKKNIETVLDLLDISAKTTTKVNSKEIFDDNGYYTIYIHTNEDTQTYYVYPKGKARYIEQQNNGTYEITNDEYGNISVFINKQRVEVGDSTKENFKEIAETLKPLDEQDKSFKIANLTNAELLRYAFLMSDPEENNVKEITFSQLNNDYIVKYFGAKTTEPQNITCNCGQIIAEYNAENDMYTWEDFHYTAHRANSINALNRVYKVEDKYVVEVIKMFADTEENFNPQNYNFYKSYSDSIMKENILDTVKNPGYEAKEYIGRISPGKLTVYKLIFTDKEPYSLVSYEIVGNYSDISESIDNGRHSANPYKLLYNKLWEWIYE